MSTADDLAGVVSDGKLQGRFWVPQYARGDAAHGEVAQTYKLEP